MARVALVKGDVRYDNVLKALNVIAADVEKIVSKSYRIVLLPNFLYPKNELTVTNVDAARAVLDFITRFTNKPISIAGSSFSLADIFSDYHYSRLEDSYSVRLVDLHNDTFKPVKINGNFKADVSKTLLDSDCIISLGMLQTHNVLLANLSLSQLILSSIQLADRKRLVLDPKAANRAVALLSKKLLPNISVIDGFSCIQGDFPLSSNILENVNVAIAGDSCFSVDAVGAAVMGIRTAQISYLKHYNSKLKATKILGEKLASCKNKFILPSNSRNLSSL